MSELVMQGLDLAMVGMGFVFGFLAVLVLLTQLMSQIMIRTGLADVAIAAPSSREDGRGIEKLSKDDITHDGRRIAAIGAAVQRHRARHG